jgi:hypothetical protein
MSSNSGSIQNRGFRPTTHQQQEGVKKLKRLDTAIRATAITALGLFALTIVFLGVAQAGYIHPVAGLISFCAILPLLLIVKILDCCQDSIARKHRIDMESWRGMEMRNLRQRTDSD